MGTFTLSKMTLEDVKTFLWEYAAILEKHKDDYSQNRWRRIMAAHGEIVNALGSLQENPKPE